MTGRSRSLRSLRLASEVNELLNCPECLKGEEVAFRSGTATNEAILESVRKPELACVGPEPSPRFTGGSRPPGILYFECAWRRYSDMLGVWIGVDHYQRVYALRCGVRLWAMACPAGAVEAMVRGG